MIAIRENERRSRFLGIPIERHIWVAFSLSCFFMALRRRALRAGQQFRRSARPALQPVRRFRHDGGDGRHARFWGPLLGAAVFVVLQDYLSSVTVNWMSFVGLLFVLVVLFFPRGLLGFLQRSTA